MNESAEQRSRTNRLGSIGLGGLLLLPGLPCWYLLASALRTLAPFADWPKELAIAGIVVPLLFVVCWKYDAGRKSEIGYLILGWLITSVVLGKLLLFMVSLAPRG
ncbi:hypothetical protein [Paraburkholderia aspalathi]|uniref:hypothetical protein n=1 Tax=Paraburkholderia aspalathi TaxID=1324617 RepID=UPI001BA653A3|nr:hypothetical protein [Paraburkholderia aspalathi]